MSSRLKEQGYRWLPLKEAWEALPPIDTPEANEMFHGYEGVWCRYIWTVTYFQQLVKDVVVISHGPLSCVASAKNFMQTHFSLHCALPFSHSPCTSMDENMLITGGSDGLLDTLKRVDREYRPRLILIADTCASWMIHDDVEGVIRDAASDVRAKVIYTPSPGFSGVQGGKAMDLMCPQTALLMDPPQRKDPEGVNVIGVYYDTFFTEAQGRKNAGNVEGYIHLIEGLGLHLHRYLNAGDYDYVRTAPEAAVNTVHAAIWGYPLAKAMEEKFGIPWIRHQLPMGLKGTRDWVWELAEHMGRQEEAERFIRKEEEALRPLFEEARALVEGKALLVECSRNSQAKVGEMLAYARLGQELGMIPYVYEVHPQELKSQVEDVVAFADVEGFNPLTLIGPYYYQFPVNVEDVIADIGFKPEDCVYIYDDVFPYAKAGSFDPSHAPRYTTSAQMKRVKGGSSWGTGYTGTAVTYRGLIESVKAAGRKNKPTLYGRVWSKTPFEFQQSPAVAKQAL